MKLSNQSLFMTAFSLVFSAQFLCVDCKAMTDVIQTSEGRLEFKDSIATKNFTINVPSAGRYYCNFWLMPALHSDSTLTSFKVLLNGNNIGKICPIVENWQSASINDKPYIDLAKGDNTISISTGTVEIPEVESIKLSKNSKNAKFPSNLYNEYIDDIISQDGMVDKETSNDDICLLSDNDGALVVAQKSSLNYSFYKLLYLKEGEEFTASATTYFSQNALDLFYYGDTDSTTNYINDLSWKQICEPVITPTSNSITPMYKATIKVRIPLTGLYMLKPRTIKSKIASIANVSINADVISCSWFLNHSDSLVLKELRNAIQYGRNGKGCVVVTSAGNNGKYITFPGDSIPEIITVGNLMMDGYISEDSSIGENLFVCAPGTRIWSTSPFNKMVYGSGTSFAAPYVAGVASLILSINPDLTYEEVRSIIALTAKKLPNYKFNIKKKYGSWNTYCGYGLVDAESAVKMALKRKYGVYYK